MGRLDGKVALITGAGSGVGEATTGLFAREGAKVLAVDINEAHVQQWSGADNVTPLLADVTRIDDVNRMIEAVTATHGRLDIVCNIAGMNDLCYPLLETDDARWDRILDLDLKAPFRICRAAIPVMIEGGGGAIVNIGSYAALRGNHGPSYTAAKAGQPVSPVPRQVDHVRPGTTRDDLLAAGGQERQHIVGPWWVSRMMSRVRRLWLAATATSAARSTWAPGPACSACRPRNRPGLPTWRLPSSPAMGRR